MNLESIHIINFQKHSDLKIDFIKGVNVIYGASEKGKSCIRRAIEFLTQHETFKGQRKIGTKATSVKGIFSNNITVERIVSNSINRYTITKDGDEQVFDSVGKTAPEEVKKAIGIYPIKIDKEEIYLNSYIQVGNPFLFDQSPSNRMKLFNKLTGNDVLDTLFSQFNKDILRIKRDKKSETEIFEKRVIELKEKTIQKEKAEAVYSRLKTRVEKIKKLYEKHFALSKLKESCEVSNSQLSETEDRLNHIKLPNDTDINKLKENIERFEMLKSAQIALEKTNIALSRVNTQLGELKPVTLDLSVLKGKIERLYSMRNEFQTLNSNKRNQVAVKGNIKDVEKDLRVTLQKYKSLLKECKICPLCKTECTEKHLDEIRL